MKCRKRFFVLPSVIVFCLFISLTSINTARAQLAITGSNQMSVNGTQTLTASGGSGGYTWSLASGAGSFTGSGESATYTAPSNNANCENNPTICVTDSDGQQECKPIAVNAYNNNAYAYEVKTFLSSGGNCYYAGENPPGGPTINYTIISYKCNGTAFTQCTSNFCNYGSHDVKSSAYCLDRYWHTLGNKNDWGITDTRTAGQKAAGCCPAALGGSSSSGNPPTHSTGNPCLITQKGESTNNLKSGNLYHSQDVGILTLSYNSIDTVTSTLGQKWTHQYNQKLTALSGNATIKLRTEDGNNIYFRLSGGVYYPENISGDTSTIVKNANGTFTRTTKSSTKYNYNTTGQLTSIVDKNGSTTTLTYTSGYLTGITDPNGRTTTITNTNGYINYITDPGGRTYTLGYTNGFLSYIADPLGNAWTFTYDSAGRMMTKTDPTGRAVAYTYDASGRILSSTDPEGLTRSMSYTASGQTAFTEKDGSLWTYKYDPTYAVKTEKTDPLGNTTRYTFDSKRNLTATIEPNGATTSYTYDAAGNMLTMTDPMGNITRYTYTSQNLVSSSTDPKGGITSYTYDAKGNLLTITTPAGAATSYTYDARGNVTSITDPRGKTTAFAYDLQNNLISITDQRGKVTTFTYDSMGNRLTATDPLGKVTTYVYNALNQMTQVTDPRGYTTNYTYDYKGNILSATDAKGNPTTYIYNYRGNVTQITDALNHITQMTYGPTGCGSGCGGGAEKLSSLTDALNHTTAYTYDAAGRLIRETDPQGRTTNYTYDANGRMTSKTKPDGRTINYTYDAAGRLIQRQYPDGTADTFTYDANGNLLSAANAFIAFNFGYDASNRLTGVTDSNTRSFTYQYDAGGNRTAMTSPEGATTTYAYNNAGSVLNISNYAGTWAFAYDDAGRRSTLNYPNGVSSTYQYDNSGNLLQVKHVKDSTTVAHINYSYDQINNRAGKADTFATESYAYDAVNRLTNNSLGENYTYDGVGNRLTGPLTSDSMTYSAGNEQLNINSATYEYDLNGNRIRKTEGGVVTTYTYDDENRLRQVTQGSTTITYAYDPFGRRIEKNVNGNIKQYVYDNEDIILECATTGTVLARYTHGPGIDEPLAVQQGTAIYYYHADGLGSIAGLSNASGTVVQRYNYDSFGKFTQSGSVTQPYTFTAREYDSETGLYYYRARYYDPQAGRFISKDPIGFEGGDVNLYAYVGNNPVNANDPWGLEAGLRIPMPYPGLIPPKYVVDAFGGGSDLRRGRNDMIDAGTTGADAYFHCRANCEASRRGQGGYDAARIFSSFREIYQNEPKEDRARDEAANAQGQCAGKGNPNVDCYKACSNLIPPWGIPQRHLPTNADPKHIYRPKFTR